MQCEQTSELMSLHLDGLVSDEEWQEVRTHLVGCDACSAQWTAMSRVATLFEAAPMAQPPVDFTARLMNRVADRRSPAPSPWRAITGWIVLLIGGLLLVSLALTLAWDSVAPWLVGLSGGLGLPALADQAIALAMNLPSIGAALVLSLPLPLILGYVLVTLALATAWVYALGRLHFRGIEQAM
ncbi:MAG: zf-HC2 domain-containing protein [Anaerolineae bacterium]